MKTALHVFQNVLTSAAVLVILGFSVSNVAQAQSTISCPQGTYDMLDWMTLDSDLAATHHLEGTSNPLYTVREPASSTGSKAAWAIRGTFNCTIAITSICG